MIAAVTGLIAGAVHVWSGPDHLTAIAPLAVRQPRQSWIPGARWGFGQSAGVAVVGCLSLWLRDLIPTEWLSSWGERMVGVMLFGIGFWGLRKAFRNQVHEHEHEHEHGGERHVHVHVHAQAKAHGRDGAHYHTHAAFGIGILHGLAGSSHFLGVLPILAFRTTGQALGYLAAFGVGTIVSMAAFSWTMGFVATRCAASSSRTYRALMSCCSIAAIGVGCFWLWSGLR